MESATEKKEHWLLIDVTKFKNSINISSLDNDNLMLFQEILTQYKELIKIEKEFEIRREKNIKIQKKIVMGFFSCFIFFQIYMLYIAPNPFEFGKIIILIMMVLTAGYIWIQRPGP